MVPGDATFAGEPLVANSVLLAYTRYGDADLNGQVNLQDFNRLASAFGTTDTAVWSQGDFNYDGNVNLQDFNRLAGNFGLSATGPEVTPQDWAALGAAVPEPVAGGAVLAGFGMLRRRRSAAATPSLRGEWPPNSLVRARARLLRSEP